MSENRPLSDAERQRFARYLRENAESSRILLKALGESALSFALPVASKLRVEIASFEYVARYLENTETLSIGPTEHQKGIADGSVGVKGD